jgi:hypothetical protein
VALFQSETGRSSAPAVRHYSADMINWKKTYMGGCLNAISMFPCFNRKGNTVLVCVCEMVKDNSFKPTHCSSLQFCNLKRLNPSRRDWKSVADGIN